MSTTDLTILTKENVDVLAKLGGLQVCAIEDKPFSYNFLIYGEPGVGKTVFAGSSSEVEGFEPVIFLDAEGGVLSLHSTYPRCKVVRAKTWNDIQRFYNDLYDTKGGGFKTLVVDSLSEIGKFCMTQIMIDVVKKEPERDFDVPSVREWGILLERMRRFIRGFRDLEHINTIMTCHVRSEKLQDNRQKNYPSLNGQLTREASGFFDFVFYMYVTQARDKDTKTVENKRMIMTAPNDKFTAKDRSGRLPVLIEEPTMQSVMATILGGN